nr:MAG TPA: hypothetical protein [Caudoviricetes sp.]
MAVPYFELTVSTSSCCVSPFAFLNSLSFFPKM